MLCKAREGLRSTNQGMDVSKASQLGHTCLCNLVLALRLFQLDLQNLFIPHLSQLKIRKITRVYLKVLLQLLKKDNAWIVYYHNDWSTVFSK